MRFSRQNLRSARRPRHHSNTGRLGVEPLEDRRMLAAFELSSLLAENGGDGSTGFIASGGSDNAGFAVSVSSDINGDGFADLLVSDPGRNTIDQPKGPRNEKTEGAVSVVFGTQQGIPAELDLPSLDGTNGFTIYGNPDDAVRGSSGGMGYHLVSGGDLNDDGVDDIAISVPFARDGENIVGRVYILYGNQSWGSTESPSVIELQSLTAAHGGDGSQGMVVSGSQIGSAFGTSAAMDGDINGDGIYDLVMGTQYYNDRAGQTVVVFGRDSASPFPAEISTLTLDGTNGFVVNGINTDDWSGYSVSAGGDLNGDQLDDLVIGAVSGTPDPQRIHSGQVFVVYGSTSFPSSLELSDIVAGDGSTGFVINGIEGNTGEGETLVKRGKAGASVHSGGDFNGDGYNDLAIGAPRATNGSSIVDIGEAYVVFGKSASEVPFPAVMELSELDGSDGMTIRGLDQGDSFGSHVALTSFNGNAYADLVITAPGGDPNGRADAGETYVVFGSSVVPTGGVIDLATVVNGAGSEGFVINGTNAGDSTGGGTAAPSSPGLGIGAGDFNGDGFNDLSIGTYFGSPPEAYVVFGGANIIPPPPAPSFSINDVTVIEGDNGTVIAEFTVTRAGDSSGTDAVNYATADGTAEIADGDYTAIPTTTLAFDPGVTALPVNVTVSGDTQQEGDETFLVNLANASAGATIADDQGVGTIQGDDAPFDPNTIYVWDIQDTLETRQRGRNNTDYRLVIDVRQDSDGDGVAEASDAGIAGVEVTVVLTDSVGQSQTLTGTTDSAGFFRSAWIKNLDPGGYRAEVTALALAGFAWDPFDSLDATNNDEDADGDGLPDEFFTID